MEIQEVEERLEAQGIRWKSLLSAGQAESSGSRQSACEYLTQSRVFKFTENDIVLSDLAKIKDMPTAWTAVVQWIGLAEIIGEGQIFTCREVVI